MKKRLDLLNAIEAIEPLGKKRRVKDFYEGIDGKKIDLIQMPAEQELLYDIAVSLRLLIDAVVETWTG